jgi:hypothetical protein
VTIAIIGAFEQAGIPSFRFNAEVYRHSVTTWLIAIIAIAFSADIINIALGALNRQIEELVCALKRQNEELLWLQTRIAKIQE